MGTPIGFHISFPMGYVVINPYLYCTSKTVANLANTRWAECNSTPPYDIDSSANTPPYVTDCAHDSLPSAARETSLANLCSRLSPASQAALLR